MIRSATATAVMMVLAANSSAWADSVSGSTQDGYGRLSFAFTGTANPKVSASATGGVLAISFSDKTAISPASVVAALPRVITSGRADADGKTLRFALTAPIKLHVSQIPGRAVVDLAPSDFSGAMPDLAVPPKPVIKAADVASLPEIKLRTGAYQKFTRLVFDWPKDVSYQVFPAAGKMTVKFASPIRVDVSAIARFAPPWVKNASWHSDGFTTTVEFETDSDSGYHDFKDGKHVVLDVLAPKTDGAAYAPPGDAKPVITKMGTKMEAAPAAKTVAAPPAKPVTGASVAQTQAVLQTAQQLADKHKPKAEPHPPAKPEAKSEAKEAEAHPPAAPAEPAPAAIPVADGKRTRDGAMITFKGAGPLPSAVFVRGLTAWVILENAPSFDSRNLRGALGDFAAGMEALSSNGLGILRITLKQPAEIAARVEDANLVVEIAGTVAPAPVVIGFARNQTDPKRTSLSTLLPAADHAFKLLDPAGGDMLTVVPSQAGRGVPAKRQFADFAALPTASGLVITPFADDLDVSVNTSRVTISRPAGLTLTPPQMPVGQTPSALARFGDGPSFMDFGRWREATGGSFLATQRKLVQSAVHAYPQDAARAQLTLARFYLANGFAAESLGLIKLMQSKDPALAGDVQLTTMKAAADYMMGRYREAHGALEGPGFDNDRHVAFWRGLIESATENWKDAHAHMEQAGPVLNRYPADWQARAFLADADAALGMGRLDLADAALTRMPKDAEAPLAMAAELAQARLMAAWKAAMANPSSASRRWKKAAMKNWPRKPSSITPMRRWRPAPSPRPRPSSSWRNCASAGAATGWSSRPCASWP